MVESHHELLSDPDDSSKFLDFNWMGGFNFKVRHALVPVHSVAPAFFKTSIWRHLGFPIIGIASHDSVEYVHYIIYTLNYNTAVLALASFEHLILHYF